MHPPGRDAEDQQGQRQLGPAARSTWRRSVASARRIVSASKSSWRSMHGSFTPPSCTCRWQHRRLQQSVPSSGAQQLVALLGAGAMPRRAVAGAAALVATALLARRLAVDDGDAGAPPPARAAAAAAPPVPPPRPWQPRAACDRGSHRRLKCSNVTFGPSWTSSLLVSRARQHRADCCHLDHGKIWFQSFFMLTTAQPSSLASVISASVNVPTWVSAVRPPGRRRIRARRRRGRSAPPGGRGRRRWPTPASAGRRWSCRRRWPVASR